MRTLRAMRYVTPLREGGSLPAVVEASDGELYVVKFHGAGQGPRALIAELIVGEMARAWGLDVPEIVLVELDEAFGRNEPDPEIRDLLRASVGTNLGFTYLPGAITYDPIAPPEVDEELASRILWLDAVTLNVDRTARNPNLLLWEGKLWLIDHGAALYFHHNWATAKDHLVRGFPQVRDHVLLRRATRIEDVQRQMRERTTGPELGALLGQVPDAWLEAGFQPGTAQALRNEYAIWLTTRLGGALLRGLPEIEDARNEHV